MEPILDFNAESFALALSNEHTTSEEIKQKAHYKKILDILGPNGLKAQRLVIESEYISRDYLHDYAEYIAYSFKKYSKVCKRVHVFSTAFTKDDFENQILDPEAKIIANFWDHYLGFIVVKPIAKTVIGYSLLKIPPENANEFSRQFVRSHTVHLYGSKTTIQGLAFQEQDSVLSACATTAIWIMLNKASATDYSFLKSPSQITKDAGLVKSDNRLFPNRDGLKVAQLGHAIRESGLEVEIISGTEEIPESKNHYVPHDTIKRLVNAYTFLGIPILLLTRITFKSKIGYHAVAVSGFKKSKEPKSSKRPTAINVLSSDITELYVHDDQIGPYSTISFGDTPHEVSTDWAKYRSAISTNIISVVVPIYPKVRITYNEIETLAINLNSIVGAFLPLQTEMEGLRWDIKVMLSENYKEVLRGNLASSVVLLRILKTSMPKYIWVASVDFRGEKFADFIFDATDLGNSMLAEHVVFYADTKTVQVFSNFLEEKQQQFFKAEVKLKYFSERYYSWLRNYIQEYYIQ